MKCFNTVNDAISALKGCIVKSNKTVFAVLSFSKDDSYINTTGVSYLFDSTQKPGAYVAKNSPSCKVTTSDKTRVSEYMDAKMFIADILGEILLKEDIIPDGRHAEESLIENFHSCLAFQEVGQVKYVNILLTHSPCTTNDKRPSDNLTDQPLSCFSKMLRLAESFDKYNFRVGFLHDFGVMQQENDSEKVLNEKSSDIKNIEFFKVVLK